MFIRLTCDGVCIANEIVPPFDVGLAEHVGVALSSDYGAQWNSIMHCLAGLSPCPEIHVRSKAAVIPLPGLESLGQTGKNHRIVDIAIAHGVSRASAREILLEHGIRPNWTYSQLGLTQRLLFQFSLAWHQGAELLVFSTGGLDPSGVVAVDVQISKRIGRCSAIHVFSNQHVRDYEADISFSKVIVCSQKRTAPHGH